ncbi:pseudouridine synthase [Methyloferula stellata]|uniref:pseudouridine synthase n=1 Tax=Methyloferula stellata TaxID=876270 RepID=UPI00035EA204|nr:pseudouridine synthase [Methyloferula stellata]
MIDKRVKNAAPTRKGENPRKGKPRPERSAVAAKPARPGLHRKPKPRKQDARPPRDETAGMRIAKVMARAGLCSRRDAEVWIEEGRVSLNGKVLTTPAINVGPEDMVTVDGVALAPRERTRLFLFHKPRGLVTTDKDPEGRQTIFDYLHQNWPDGPRVISIGRLDINTEGLLLLTNDGGLARVLELPSTAWVRRYRVRANGKTDQAVLDRLRDGLTVDGIDYAGIDATLDRVQGDNVWLSLGLREGKNREIKRVLEHIGLYVNRLIRVSYGPFQLGDLAEGKVEEVRTRILRDQLGPTLANEADADFDSPIAEPHKEEAPPPRGQVRARGPREAGGDSKPARTHGDTPRPRGRDHKPSPLRGDRRASPDKREAPAPVEPSFKPRGPRKHISAMRATGATPEQGERKRSFLSETADRKGRAVVVERKAKVAPRRREEPARDQQEARAPRAASRFKTGNAERPSGKTRTAGKPSARQDAASRSPDGKRTPRKPASEAAAKPAAARPQGTYPKGTYPKGANSKSANSRGANPKGARPASAAPRAGRPVKPGRPPRPR